MTNFPGRGAGRPALSLPPRLLRNTCSLARCAAVSTASFSASSACCRFCSLLISTGRRQRVSHRRRRGSLVFLVVQPGQPEVDVGPDGLLQGGDLMQPTDGGV